MAPHSSTLAWKIPWMEEPGGLQSMRSQRVGYDWATSFSLFTFHFHALEKEMATHSSVLAWRIPGTGEPVGLPSMGLHRVGHDWSDLAAAAATDILRGQSHSSVGKKGRETPLVFHIVPSICTWVNQDQQLTSSGQKTAVLLLFPWSFMERMDEHLPVGATW